MTTPSSAAKRRKKAAPATAFDRNGRQGILHFAWTGGLVNPLMRIAAGGVAYGTYAAGGHTFYDHTGTNGGGPRSQGLNILASWDFDTDFGWSIGQAGGNQTAARFSDGRRMGPASATPMLSMPVTLDILQNGTGPAGLCFGGGFASGAPVASSCTSAPRPCMPGWRACSARCCTADRWWSTWPPPRPACGCWR